AAIVIDAEKIELGFAELHVARLDPHHVEGSFLHKGFRIRAFERWFDEPDIAKCVSAVRGGFVFGAGSGWFAIGHAECGTDLQFWIDGFDCLECLALGNVDDVSGAHAIAEAVARGSVNAPSVAEESENPGLIENAPVLNAITEGFDDNLCVVGEAASKIAIGPTAGVFEGLRKIPVIERANGANLRFEKRVGETLVVIETFFDGGA